MPMEGTSMKELRLLPPPMWSSTGVMDPIECRLAPLVRRLRWCLAACLLVGGELVPLPTGDGGMFDEASVVERMALAYPLGKG
jgi:hypothetical protein